VSSELEVALAQVFRKKGKSSLAEKEFVFAASLDLRWFTPKEAQKFLEIGLESELLAMDGNKVKPTFDYKTADAPPGYKPTTDLLKSSAQPKGLFLKLVDVISTDKDIPKKTVISEVNDIQDRMNIETEVAVLVVARSHDVDIKEYLDEVEEGVAARYKKISRNS